MPRGDVSDWAPCTNSSGARVPIRIVADVLVDKTSCAVGDLHLTRAETTLAEYRSVLVDT